MAAFQVWLVGALRAINPVGWFMTSAWGWAIAESIHFLGLSLLIGAVGVFDLRLLGVGKRIPVMALHRLIPWGLAGYATNVVSGLGFLMTEPDQYIFNAAFQLKLLLMAIAGVNALMFYVIGYRVSTNPDTAEVPRSAKIAAAISLCMWVGVIICGRMIAFYRPINCGPEGHGFVASCFPRLR